MFILSEDYFCNSIAQKTIDEIKEALSKKEEYYHKIEIKNKNKKRTIYEITTKSKIYMLQKNIVNNFLNKVELPNCVNGFVTGLSYNTYLYEHINKKYYLKLDIKDFFGQITIDIIKDNLLEFVKEDKIIDLIKEICTLKGIVPQGAVSSPSLSNLIFRRIDQRITKYCQKLEVTYTRYADDLLFSSDVIDFKEKKWFYRKIKYILRQYNFELNIEKNRFENGQIAVSGYVVKGNLQLSRKKLKDINNILYYFKDNRFTNKYVVDQSKITTDMIQELNDFNEETKKFKNLEQFINYICGYRSFLISIFKTNEGEKAKKIKNKITNIEKIVNSMENIKSSQT